MMGLTLHFDPEAKLSDLRALTESFALAIRADGRTLQEIHLYYIQAFDLISSRTAKAPPVLYMQPWPHKESVITMELETVGPPTEDAPRRRSPFFVEDRVRFTVEYSTPTWSWIWDLTLEPNTEYHCLNYNSHEPNPVITQRTPSGPFTATYYNRCKRCQGKDGPHTCGRTEA